MAADNGVYLGHSRAKSPAAAARVTALRKCALVRFSYPSVSGLCACRPALVDGERLGPPAENI